MLVKGTSGDVYYFRPFNFWHLLFSFKHVKFCLRNNTGSCIPEGIIALFRDKIKIISDVSLHMMRVYIPLHSDD